MAPVGVFLLACLAAHSTSALRMQRQSKVAVRARDHLECEQGITHGADDHHKHDGTDAHDGTEDDACDDIDNYPMNDLLKTEIAKGKKITMQATCHSYSGVVSPVAGSSGLSLLQFKKMFIDKENKEIIIGPGVRFCDTIKPLEEAGLSLGVHGDYSGQTIIGAVLTGTHGYGFASAANFITSMKVVNGKGEWKELGPNAPNWGSWLNSAGGLGAVTEMTMKLVDPFNIKIAVDWVDVKKDVKGLIEKMKANHYLTVAWWSFLPEWMPAFQEGHYMLQARTITEEPRTHFVEWHNGFTTNLTFSYMQDFAFAPSDEPESAGTRHCHQVTPQVFQVQDGATENVIPALSMDISFAPDDAEMAIHIMNNLAWSKNVSFYARYTAQDTVDMPLSPYFDGPRIGIDIALNHADWEGKRRNIGDNDPILMAWKADVILVIEECIAAGLKPRFHIGKSGFMEFPFWDMGRLKTFEEAAEAEDPNDLFTNEFLELMKAQNSVSKPWGSGASNPWGTGKWIFTPPGLNTSYVWTPPAMGPSSGGFPTLPPTAPDR